MTLDQLKRRGLTLANRFPLCGLDEVNIEHLSLFYGLGPVDLSLGSHGYYLGASFYGKRSTGWLEKNYNEKGGEKNLVGCSCLFWAIWKERNKVVFDKEDFSLHKLKRSFVFASQTLPVRIKRRRGETFFKILEMHIDRITVTTQPDQIM